MNKCISFQKCEPTKSLSLPRVAPLQGMFYENRAGTTDAKGPGLSGAVMFPGASIRCVLQLIPYVKEYPSFSTLKMT